MRNLSIEYKIEVFETLALSRLVNLALLTVFPNHINEEVVKIQFFYEMIHTLELNNNGL